MENSDIVDVFIDYYHETSENGFCIGLYSEHIEESGFLYHQKQYLFDDREITWLELETWEKRNEPHLDALVIGQDLALAVCRKRAKEQRSEYYYPIVRVYCHQDQQNLFVELMDELDPGDPDAINAVANALIDENPEHWESFLVSLLSKDGAQFILVLAKLFGALRWSYTKELYGFLGDTDDDMIQSTIISALGKIKTDVPVSRLMEYIPRFMENDTYCSDAAIALTRLRNTRWFEHIPKAIAMNQWWIFIPMSLAGPPQANRLIRNALDKAESPHPHALLALGILGLSESIDYLMTYLENDEFATIAATALNLITGANLFKHVFVPEEIDEEWLYDEQKERIAKGEPPYLPGEEPGENMFILSEDPEDWKKWLEENGDQFEGNLRYRNGKPYSPLELVYNLEFERTPHQVRQLVALELEFRYKIDHQFEATSYVSRQKEVIEACKRSASDISGRYQAGRWYLNGRLQNQN